MFRTEKIGKDKHTYTQTDIATSRLHRPRPRLRENVKWYISKKKVPFVKSFMFVPTLQYLCSFQFLGIVTSGFLASAVANISVRCVLDLPENELEIPLRYMLE